MLFTVAAAALATGVSAHRLRTWERRYGVPTPERGLTGRRIYTDGDIAVIRRMAALVESGLNAAAAAAAVHDESVTTSSFPLIPAQAPAVPPEVLALVDAAETYDQSRVLEMLDLAARASGVEAAVEQLVLPALVEAGQRWERADMTVAAEHLLAEAARAWLGAQYHSIPTPSPTAPRVLVACPEDERHDLGALALALLLKRAGLRVAYLGADVPTATLVEATRGARFDALCLSLTVASSLPMTRVALAVLLAAGGNMRVYVGGQAIVDARSGEADLLAAVRLPASVVTAANTVASQLLRTRTS